VHNVRAKEPWTLIDRVATALAPGGQGTLSKRLWQRAQAAPPPRRGGCLVMTRHLRSRDPY